MNPTTQRLPPDGASASSADTYPIADGDSSSSSSSADDVEPILKYERLRNDVQKMLQQDSVTCIAFNSKIICIGTCWGLVQVFDHQGNRIPTRHLHAHTVAVNQVSLDLSGEFVATCANDGKAYVNGLYATDHKLEFKSASPVHSVAIDPLYYKLGSRKRFISGGERLWLHEKHFLAPGLHTSALSELAGNVPCIKWCSRFVACCCRDRVRVYDIEERRMIGFILWDSPEDDLILEQHRCSLLWSNSATLLIGWLRTVRICRIEKRCSTVKESPSFRVNVVFTIRVDHFICGISSLDVNHIVLLAFRRKRDSKRAASPPRIYVFQATDDKFVEMYSDTLSVRSHRDYVATDYLLECMTPDIASEKEYQHFVTTAEVTPRKEILAGFYHENQLIIACPKDVIVATMYNDDDRVEFLISREKFEQALELVVTTRRKLAKRHSRLQVGRKYVDYLLQRKEFVRAAEICSQIMGNDKKLWENEAFKFARAGQLRAISRYLPVDPQHKLNPLIYEMVLYECLKHEPEDFPKIVQQWPLHLYDVHAIKTAVQEYIIKFPHLKQLLPEPVGLFDMKASQYDSALYFYLTLRNNGVFDFIREHKLHKNLAGKLSALFDVDAELAVNLILEENQRLPAEQVVSELQQHPYYRFLYLDALQLNYKRDAYKYHPQLLELYARFCPVKVLPFLRRSRNYCFHTAVAICEQYNLHREAVYLLGSMGNVEKALDLLIDKMEDVEQAVHFCRRHNDPDLWMKLIELSLTKPEFVAYLLEKVDKYVDVRFLICRLSNDVRIPSLKRFLVKILQDRKQRILLHKSCKNIIVSDSYDLYQTFVDMKQCGSRVDGDMVCWVCDQRELIRDSVNKIIVFYCGHRFHEQCLQWLKPCGTRECIICS